MGSKELGSEAELMSVVAGAIGSRAAGIAGATFTTADLARARVFYIARLGFPLMHEEEGAFTFGAGASTITVRGEALDSPLADGSGSSPSGLARIALWCAGLDDLRTLADALTAAGIEHSRTDAAHSGGAGVAFNDPDGIEWELRVR